MEPPARSFTIRRIRADEGAALRSVRIRSLSDAPDAFGQTLADVDDHPPAVWDRLARQSSSGESSIWLFADLDGVVIGVVQGRRRRPATVLIFSMWVDESHRRRDVGRSLIDGLDRWARGWGATASVLWVLRSNGTARDFYDRVGYELVVEGPDADTGSRFDAYAMTRSIRPIEPK